MISHRADFFNYVQKHRDYDVFFYVWIHFDSAVGDTQNPMRDSHGKLSAGLEVYFPDKLNKRDVDANVAAKIKQKIESAIERPINQGLVSNKDEVVSEFFLRLKQKFGPMLQKLSEEPIEFESVKHGMRFHLKMDVL